MDNDSWRSLPNGPLLNEVLKLAKSSKMSAFDISHSRAIKLAAKDWDMTYKVMRDLGREGIQEWWLDKICSIKTGDYDRKWLCYAAGLVLITYDGAGEFYKQPVDKLKLTMLLLPKTDWRHVAAVALLPFSENVLNN